MLEWCGCDQNAGKIVQVLLDEYLEYGFALNIESISGDWVRSFQHPGEVVRSVVFGTEERCIDEGFIDLQQGPEVKKWRRLI